MIFEWRCKGKDPTKAEPCNKLLGKFEDLRQGSVKCPRCGFVNTVTWPSGKPQEPVDLRDLRDRERKNYRSTGDTLGSTPQKGAR